MKRSCLLRYMFINMSDRCKEKVTLEDVKKYLSSEFDEEGNLYVLNKNNKVHDYIEWYRKRVITDTGMDFGRRTSDRTVLDTPI